MGKTTIMVTQSIVHRGMRVCRGRDWKAGWNEQDMVNGVQVPGTIIEESGSSPGWYRVQWDQKSSAAVYRVGAEGCYDLYVWEDDGKSLGHVGVYTSVSQLAVGQQITVANLDDEYMVKNGLVIGQVCTVEHIDGRHLRVKGKEWWVPPTCFTSMGSAIPEPPSGPVIKDNLADWSKCAHLLKVGMELLVINDTFSHWVTSGGLKAGDITTLVGIGSTSFQVKTPIHGNLNIDRRCFGLPHQGAVGSVFINRKIKITANERRTSPRAVQVRRKTPSVRSAKSGSGRAVRG